MIELKKLQKKDFKIYYNLISQLSNIEFFSIQKFNDYIDSLNNNHHIYLLYVDNCIFGCGSIVFEQKITYNFKYVAHIEDIVIDSKYRGLGYGNTLLDLLIDKCKDKDCYKIILNCKEELIEFYQKCGFNFDSYCMRINI